MESPQSLTPDFDDNYQQEKGLESKNIYKTNFNDNPIDIIIEKNKLDVIIRISYYEIKLNKENIFQLIKIKFKSNEDIFEFINNIFKNNNYKIKKLNII